GRRLPAEETRLEEEDHGPERGQALRHKGAGRVPAEGWRDARRPGGARRRARGARGLGGMTNPVTAGSPSAPPGQSPPGAARVLAALDAVRDPELDEPITSLGFVSSCTVSADGDAQVRLRLPTYFCAPNFAFLMVAAAYAAPPPPPA